MEKFYVYVFLDPRKPGKYVYDNICFTYEPFYIGKGTSNRIIISKYSKLNPLKTNKIKKIESSGLNVISYKLFDNLTETDSFDIEMDLIKRIGKILNETGPLVNFSDGGTGGDNISNHPNRNEIVEKMKLSHLGTKNGFYGKNHTELTKQKLSEIMVEITSGERNGFYGKKHTELTKQKQSDIKKNKYDGEKNPFFGKKHNEDTKNIIRKKASERKHSELTKQKISESGKGKRVGLNNPSATKYIIETPEGNVLEFIGIKTLDLALKGINPRRILKQKEHKGYKLIDVIKLNKK
jgi:hypothetical protein